MREPHKLVFFGQGLSHLILEGVVWIIKQDYLLFVELLANTDHFQK